MFIILQASDLTNETFLALRQSCQAIVVTARSIYWHSQLRLEHAIFICRMFILCYLICIEIL